MDFSVEQIIISLGYIGIFLMMVANGLSSFPSSQILYIIVGYFISVGSLNLFFASFLGALGNTVGNILLYELVRNKGLEYVTKFKLFPEREIRKVQIAFEKRGAWFLFIGKLLPAIKVYVPIPAALGKMNRVLYIFVTFISSYIWSLSFIAVGFFFGKSANVFGKYAIVLTVVAFVVIYGFYKYINSESIIKEIES